MADIIAMVSTIEPADGGGLLITGIARIAGSDEMIWHTTVQFGQNPSTINSAIQAAAIAAANAAGLTVLSGDRKIILGGAV